MNLVEFVPKGDERGWLVALEATREVPFPIRRVYYIFGTDPTFRRGKHAHRKLRQLAVCVAGSCRFVVDNGAIRREFQLNRNTLGLLLEPITWREMYDFSPDCVLMVLASELYDPNDYILDYEQFLAEVEVLRKS